MKSNRWPEDWPILIIQLLAVPGMMVAFYLLLYHNGDLIGACSASGWDDCGQVSGPGAKYAAIGPVPVALIGLAGYAAIFLAVWLANWWSWIDENIPELMIVLTGLAFLFSLGLTVLEIFVIGAICRYCVVSAIIVTVMFVLALIYRRKLQRAGT
ncbi:MAG TPA: vitamin K epoxide reductase family protein [candidate division Zixibacteria bacterium]|nr:vitamin K epoxide reductase family protein [candidate division Zixibacteria bacterium]